MRGVIAVVVTIFYSTLAVTAQLCSEGDVRLADGRTENEGRVEICLNEQWGTVCSNWLWGFYWSFEEARVTCRQLGFDYSLPQPQYGGGSGQINTISCNGDETYLESCPGQNSFNVILCTHADDAGVICRKDPECSNTDVRLIDGDTPDEGRVEICRDGFWGSVCSNNWDERDATVVCRQLGYDGSSSPVINHPVYTTTSYFYYLDDVTCRGTENKLNECRYGSGRVLNTCIKDVHDAGVMCTNQTLTPPPAGSTEVPPPGAGSTEVPPPGAGSTEVPPPAGSTEVPVGSILAGVIVPIVVLAAIIGVTLLIFVIYKMRRNKQLRRMQLDICAVGAHDVPVVNLEKCDNLRINQKEMGQAKKSTASITGKNTYSMPTSTDEAQANMVGHGFRTRVSSFHMRELGRCKILIKDSNITLLYCIGEGEFGIVFMARLKRSNRTVAVKTLKGDFDQVDVNKFMEESLKMSRFKHAHVMGLIGVCLDAGSAPYIIMPYMANGSLLKYLKKERDNIVLLEETDEDEIKEVRKRLMVMCSQIASGMQYLADNKYIHRDLAARNCMINTTFLIKITDFGLSEDMFERNYFRQDHSSGDAVKLPIKWMAPESLSDGHFSEKSDVWSYGVTMWEIFSGGKSPYPGTDPRTLTQSLEEGFRLPQPYNSACCQEIYEMMMQCWEKAPESRPTFKELYSNISKYIERVAGYLDIGFNPFTAGGGGEEAGEGEEEADIKEEEEEDVDVDEREKIERDMRAYVEGGKQEEKVDDSSQVVIQVIPPFVETDI